MIRLVLAEDQAMVLGAFAQLLGLEPDLEVVATAVDGPAALAAVEAEFARASQRLTAVLQPSQKAAS